MREGRAEVQTGPQVRVSREGLFDQSPDEAWRFLERDPTRPANDGPDGAIVSYI